MIRTLDPGKPLTDFEQVADMICKVIYILKSFVVKIQKCLLYL